MGGKLRTGDILGLTSEKPASQQHLQNLGRNAERPEVLLTEYCHPLLTNALPAKLWQALPTAHITLYKETGRVLSHCPEIMSNPCFLH